MYSDVYRVPHYKKVLREILSMTTSSAKAHLSQQAARLKESEKEIII